MPSLSSFFSMDIEKKRKSKIALDIVSFSGVFLLFVCSLLCLIARFNGSRFDLFGNRYDVVLTDSMASKNPEHAEFLEPYNDQFKAFDLAISRKLPEPEELKVGDVVVFTDRNIGTNMHRIVDVEPKYSESVKFINATATEINGKHGVILNDLSSSIDTSDIRFETMSITTYTSIESTDNLAFYVLSEKLTPEVTKVDANDGSGKSLVTYNLKRTTKAPGKIKIYHKNSYEFSEELITSIHIDSLVSPIDVDFNNLIPVNSGTNNYEQAFNVQYAYQIRGDAAKDADGWYAYNELQALVKGNAHGCGYVIRFMGSIWGGLMFALLAILILVVELILGRMNKKELVASEIAQETKEKENPIEEPKEQPKEEPKPIEQPKVEEPKPEPVKEEPKPIEQPKVEEQKPEPVKEEIKKDKPEQPARVNGRFVSKKAAPAKPASNSSRWTKENNPSVNKKRAEGGQK